MIVLSADPGTKNFAACVAEHSIVRGKFKSNIIGTGMLEDTFTEMTGSVTDRLHAFESSLIVLRKEFKPDVVYFERFQSRGLKGTTIECINMMLAIMVRVFRHQDPRLILASTWKNRINKKIDLKATYKDYHLTRKYSPKTCHELDATLIGMYGACKTFDIPDFHHISEENWDAFMQWFLERPNLHNL